MSNGRGRGLVFFVLIGAVAVVGVFALLRMRKPAPESGAEVAESDSRGPRSPIKGTGTSWREEGADAEPSGTIEGVVLDADGKPVDGARVALGRARGRGEDFGAAFSFMQPKGLAVSSGGGRFRITDLVPGDYAATAVLDAWGPGQVPSIAVKAKEVARIELKLTKGGLLLQGRVLDVGGGGVGGARLTLVGRGSGQGRAPLLLATVSDSEGKYRITLAKGQQTLRIEADGYAPATENFLLARPTTRDLRLVPAARLSGRVVERGTKQPVADAEVSLTSALRNDFRPARDVKADSAGAFTFTALEPGSYEVMARRGVLIGAGRIVALAVAQTVDEIEIEVERGYTVSGRVKDEKGAAVGGVRIHASRDMPPFGQPAKTRANPDGTYALEGLLPGAYRLWAYDEHSTNGRAQAKVVAADVRDVNIVMPEAVKVSGKVTTADGRPVEGARISATLQSPNPGGGFMVGGDSATSGPDGSFELKRIGPGRLTVSARHEDVGVAKLPAEEVKSGENKTLALVIKKGASVSGVVRLDDGRPAVDITVIGVVRDTMMTSSDARDVTGPDGRYHLKALSAGRITVTANRTGRMSFGPQDEPHQKSLTLAEGEDKTGVDLTVPSPVGATRGIAVSADGKPVPGAVISAGPDRPGGMRSARPDDPKAYSGLDGAWSMEDLAKGTFTFWASHPDFPDAEVKGVAAGSTNVKIQFPADTVVSGVVVGPDGKPAPHYTVTILPGPKPNETPEDKRRRQQMGSFEGRMQRIQDPGGAFEIRRLAGGSHELAFATAAGENATHVVEVQAGQRTAGLRVQLQAGVRVTGKVIDHKTKQPIAGASVNLTGTGGARSNVETAADGTFSLVGSASSGSVNLSISADFERHVPEHKPLEIKAGVATLDAGVIRLFGANFQERMRLAEDRGMSGIVLDQNRPALVKSVVPDSAAAEAGIKPGDVFVAVSRAGAKEPTTDLGMGAMQFLIGGKVDDTVAVSVETPGQPAREATLKLRAPRRGPPPAPAGAAQTARK